MIETDIRNVLDSVAVDVIEGVLGNTSEVITDAVVFDDPLGVMENSTLGVSLACGEVDVERLSDKLGENDAVAVKITGTEGSVHN